MKYEGSKKTVRGSFTVEAAFICPIVLLTVFTLLMHAFRLHDRVLERTALSLEVAAAARNDTGEAFPDPLPEADGTEAGKQAVKRQAAKRTRRLLSARICETKNELLVERRLFRVSGSVGDYGESRLLLRPEDVLRKKVLFEEEDH